MHDIRFRDPAGTVRNGLLHDDHVHFGDDAYDLEAVDVLAPAEPTKIVCVGRNYARHAEERGEDVPDRPLLFLKPPNAVASHGSTITLPAGKERIEHEAELAVVIDEQCKDVDPEDAEDVIRGYTCFNDVSNRDDQSREQNWVRGKAFDNAAPMGPVLAEEIPDDAAVELRVNGETRQSSSIEHFIFSIPELIAEITTYMTLEPGDVIATGTPEGVGPLTDGDHVEIEIEGIGTLEHDVRQDA
ncbi:fumarylacetoacetate hydrolase family protein [Halapricum desulfuricans]|uniref:2-keto-4-pentenoate hydratase/2-oxohepta-3-ene-1,7-dioic acid hydratase (Catechol pathway) n=1 Tax=Halapricum desulfuricans TaxID=2841257 RepID=A0A897N387_9EURY|nr:fumarylacetoacetate hydrolase family protein [Halapricum desulfuricans]QSG06951.1 2-keto-4-pentenoate hydratase/2-oxohepta-3-ene-1,7-dioic acid hydratase (catechol pathway) [Halapricum desulfuricans]